MIIWRSAYIKLMARLMTEQVLETGVMSNVYHPKSIEQALFINGMRELFRQELAYVGRWRQETVVRDNWSQMPAVWRRVS